MSTADVRDIASSLNEAVGVRLLRDVAPISPPNAAALYRGYSDRLAHATFRYSITYLALPFAALPADHCVR
jgi:hypothetical protein